jgi:transposase
MPHSSVTAGKAPKAPLRQLMEWTPPEGGEILVIAKPTRIAHTKGAHSMSTVTIAVDLAKNVFELAVAGRAGSIHERKRLSRPQFERFWVDREPCRVVMEACASAHFWGRFLIARGFDVILLPPGFVRPYRRRNKTDRADCEALLEADRCAGIHPVSVKSEDQQALLALHRVRSQWLQTRTARINAMRGLLLEFGVIAPLGPKRFMNELHTLLATKQHLPPRVCMAVTAIWDEVRDAEDRIKSIETELECIAHDHPVIQSILKVPGVGVLTATALFATIADIHSFKSGRQLACWIGLTPRESSSGGKRRLGRISKQGDAYLRVLLIHGARAALNGATRLENADKSLTQLQAWSLKRASVAHRYKAAVALANKIVRIVWAVWYHNREFNGNHVMRVAA